MTVVEGDSKAPFSKAITPRGREGRYCQQNKFSTLAQLQMDHLSRPVISTPLFLLSLFDAFVY